MPTTTPTTPLSDRVKKLSEAIRESDLTADEVLAFLAYATHGDTKPITAARDAGASIGSVGTGAHMLKDRIKNELA